MFLGKFHKILKILVRWCWPTRSTCFSPEPSFDIIPKVVRKNFCTEKFLRLRFRIVGRGPLSTISNLELVDLSIICEVIKRNCI